MVAKATLSSLLEDHCLSLPGDYEESLPKADDSQDDVYIPQDLPPLLLTAFRWVVLKFQHATVSPGVHVKSQIIELPPPRVPDLVGVEWDLGVCISNKFLGDANAAGLDTTLSEPLF